MALRLLCDEHVGKAAFYPQLQQHFTVKHVLDEAPLGAGADDDEVWNHAVNVNFNVLTADDHFPQSKADPQNGTHPGVIYYDDAAAKSDLIRALRGISTAMTSSRIASNNLTLYIPGRWPSAAP